MDTFEITPKQGADRELVLGAAVKVTHQGTLTDYTLTEYSGAKAGTYYRANMPYGVYDIYVDGTKIKDNHPFGIDRPYTFIETLDPDGLNQVNGAKLKNSSVPLASLSQATKDYIDASGGGTITNFPDEVYLDENASSELTWHDDKIKRFETGDAAASNGIDKAGVYPHLKNNNVINVKDFGAVEGGGTDATASIQAALDHCRTYYSYTPSIGGSLTATKAKVVAEGDYLISSTININCEVDFSRATFIVAQTFTGIAVKVQSATANYYLQLQNSYLPNIKVAAISTIWAYDNTGLQLVSLIHSKITLGDVYGFRKGVDVTTHTGLGFVYNDIFLKVIANNKVGLHIYPTGTGWTTENNWYGGRLALFSGFSSYVGTVSLHLTGNQNIFYKLCLEGDNDETKIWLDANTYASRGCNYNTFFDLRPEATSPWKLLADGSNCSHNLIFGGYINNFANDVDYVSQNSAPVHAVNLIMGKEMIFAGNLGSTGTTKLSNTSGNTYPIITLYEALIDPKSDPDDFNSSIGCRGFEFRGNQSYANPYLKASYEERLYIGRGNLAIATAPYFRVEWQDSDWQLTLKQSPLCLPDNSYSENWLIMGSNYLWVDTTGDLRIKSGKPTSDTDGTVIGQQ